MKTQQPIRWLNSVKNSFAFPLLPALSGLSMHILTPWDLNLDLEMYYCVITQHWTMQCEGNNLFCTLDYLQTPLAQAEEHQNQLKSHTCLKRQKESKRLKTISKRGKDKHCPHNDFWAKPQLPEALIISKTYRLGRDVLVKWNGRSSRRATISLL